MVEQKRASTPTTDSEVPKRISRRGFLDLSARMVAGTALGSLPWPVLEMFGLVPHPVAMAATGLDTSLVRPKPGLEWLTFDLQERIQKKEINIEGILKRKDLATGKEYGIVAYSWGEPRKGEGGWGLKMADLASRSVDWYKLPSGEEAVDIEKEYGALRFLGGVKMVDGKPIAEMEGKDQVSLVYNPDQKTFIPLRGIKLAFAALDNKTLVGYDYNNWGPLWGLTAVDIETGEAKRTLLDSGCQVAACHEVALGENGEKAKRLFVVNTDGEIVSAIVDPSKPDIVWEKVAKLPFGAGSSPDASMYAYHWYYGLESDGQPLPVTPDGTKLLFDCYVYGCQWGNYDKAGWGTGSLRRLFEESYVDGAGKEHKYPSEGQLASNMLGILDLRTGKVRFIALPEYWHNSGTGITDTKVSVPSVSGDGKFHTMELSSDPNDPSGLLKDEALFVEKVEFDKGDVEGETDHNFTITTKDGRRYKIDLFVPGMGEEERRRLRDKIGDLLEKSRKTGDPLFLRYGGAIAYEGKSAPCEIGALTLSYGPGRKKDGFGIGFYASLRPVEL